MSFEQKNEKENHFIHIYEETNHQPLRFSDLEEKKNHDYAYRKENKIFGEKKYEGYHKNNEISTNLAKQIEEGRPHRAVSQTHFKQDNINHTDHETKDIISLNR